MSTLMDAVDHFGVPLQESVEAVWQKFDKYYHNKKFFIDWMNQQLSERSEDDVAMYVGAEERQEPEPGEEPEEEQSEEQYPDLEEKMEDWFRERFADWENEFHQKAKFDQGGLLVYRCMGTDNIDKLVKSIQLGKFQKGYKGIGIFWAWDEDAAECHWGKGKEHVVVVGSVPASSIDAESTVNHNLNMSLGEDEKEITLKPGAKVKILQIKDSQGLPIYDFEKPKVLAASY